jgi:hypothetical protein
MLGVEAHVGQPPRRAGRERVQRPAAVSMPTSNVDAAVERQIDATEDEPSRDGPRPQLLHGDANVKHESARRLRREPKENLSVLSGDHVDQKGRRETFLGSSTTVGYVPFLAASHAVPPLLSCQQMNEEVGVERLAAVTVLALGALVLLATAVSMALGYWENAAAKVLVLLVVAVGMWRAAGHLGGPSHAG